MAEAIAIRLTGCAHALAMPTWGASGHSTAWVLACGRGRRRLARNTWHRGVVAVLSRALLAAVMGVLLLASAAIAQDVDTRTRSDIRERYGPPQGFAILYYDHAEPDGSLRAATIEQWSYYSDGVEYIFADERLVEEVPVALPPGMVVEPVVYDPGQFGAYMSLEEIVAAADLIEYVGGSVDQVIPGGETYFAHGLTFGIKDGELRYVEALAFSNDGTLTDAAGS